MTRERHRSSIRDWDLIIVYMAIVVLMLLWAANVWRPV